jgi:hypothetical protein
MFLYQNGNLSPLAFKAEVKAQRDGRQVGYEADERRDGILTQHRIIPTQWRVISNNATYTQE